MKHSKSAFTLVEVMIALVIVGLLLAIAFPLAYSISKGAGVFGPTRSDEITVTRLYVDYSGGKDSQSSHYMVGTDKGVFEVDNGLFLGLWNADELYARLKEGQRYRVTTEGNKVVNFWTQSYPYITAVEPIMPVESAR
jgi:prepilin-type N-terminal cleavage/methylation domain-containing protein